MFVKREYCTLEDFIIKCENGVYTDYYLGQDVTKGFIHVLMAVFELQESNIKADLSSTEANTLWCRYIAPYYMHSYITFVDNQDLATALATDPVFKEWLTKYCAIFNRTYARYKKLIGDYETAKATLMDDISQSTTTRFNDTPQNGGDFSSDSYTTNYTKSETKTPLTTKMARLEEIRIGWDNLYKTWADEFDGLFITSAEIND